MLSLEVCRRRTSGFGLEGFVHAFMTAVLLGFAGLDEFGDDAEAETHQAERVESRARELVAKGAPSSVRIRLGRPYS